MGVCMMAPMTPRRFTPEQEREVVAAYERGSTLRQLAQRWECSTAAVSGVLKRHDVDVRATGGQRKLAGADLDEVVSRYQAGESLKRLAEQFGCTSHAVNTALRFAGVERRASSWRPTRQFREEQVAEMVRRWQAGEAQNKIAQVIGCSQVTVSRVLREQGLEPEARLARKDRNASWKGGRIKAPGGYMQVLVGFGDPLVASMVNRMGYVLEHRLVMARSLGRPLTPDETVHHLNGIKDDNRIENLELWTGRHGRGIRAHEPHCRTCTCFQVSAS